ncbi:hypothetical protein Ddye_006854 [Dipteronia dyeriana]|uniref:Uncharacterized protein n=1 Tax=Dipteronia dyeriana TaxID=168575 RepID=A0AAD9XJE6_9ROSI|nr:hypothetical protein Ddye_006854 [Dipteronia dyeriana]
MPKLLQEISIEVTNLEALQPLNLSHDFFSGRIPETIGAMRSLESMDFSLNWFSGEIHNNCTDTLPVPNNESGEGQDGNDPDEPEVDWFYVSKALGFVPEVGWFYVSMALGFVVGFWIVIGPLLVHRR